MRPLLFAVCKDGRELPVEIALGQSGGDIRVESQVGAGTTFDIYLPAVARPEPADEDTHPAFATGGRETILLVDDEPGVLQLARHVLASAGCTVLAASSGGAARQLLARHSSPVHLIPIDASCRG